MLPEQISLTKKQWPVWAKVLIGLGIAILLAVSTLLIFLYTTNQSGPLKLIRGAQEPKVEILTTTDEAKPGDIFGVDVKADDTKEVTSVKFYVDGTLEGTCEGETECNFTSGPFSDDDIGGHKYETEFTYSDGTSYKKSGTFSVTEKKGNGEDTQPEEDEASEPANAPQIKYFYTSNNYLSEGDLLVASLAITNTQEIDYLDIKIDNESKKICSDTTVCSLSFVIPKNLNLGKHSVTGRAIGTNGLISYINRSFFVIKKTAPAEVYIPPAISISPSHTEAEANKTISFSVNVNPGSKTLEKTKVNVGLVTVKECAEKTCNYTNGGPYPQYAGLSLPYHAIAYFTDGTYIATGLQTIAIKSMATPDGSDPQPEPADDEPIAEQDTESPVVTAKAGKASMLNNEETTISAQASDNKKVSQIVVLVDGKIARTCNNTTTCSTNIGPFANITENKTLVYGAYAYDSSGNHAWSGYSSIQVNIPEQIEEPTLNLNLNKKTFNPDESVSMTATVYAGSKVLDYHTISFNGFVLKNACFFESCTVSASLISNAGQTIPIFAKAFFTDGSTLTTKTQTITVSTPEIPEVPAEPTMNFNSNKNSVSEDEGFDMTATVDTNGKTITKIQITNNNNTVYRTCNNATTCYYDASLKPWTVGTHPFRATATFSDNTIINSGLKTVTVTTAQEPTIVLTKDKNPVVLGDVAVLTAIVDQGDKTITKLEILNISNEALETCYGITTCSYNQNHTFAGITLERRARATFSDNTIIMSDTLSYFIANPPEPTIEISKDVVSPIVGDTVNITANVNPENKTIHKLEIISPLGGSNYTTCPNSPTCTYTKSNVSYAGVPTFFQAKVTFTDSTTLLSNTISYFVSLLPTEEPTLSISFSPDQPSVTASTNCLIRSVVDSKEKTILSHKIYTEVGLATTCNTEICSYTAPAYIMLGYTPSRSSGIMAYSSQIKFTDGTSITNAGDQYVTVTGD